MNPLKIERDKCYATESGHVYRVVRRRNVAKDLWLVEFWDPVERAWRKGMLAMRGAAFIKEIDCPR